MKDLRHKLHEMYQLEHKAKTLEKPNIRTLEARHKKARAVADKAYQALKEYYTSDLVLIADIDILLSVMVSLTWNAAGDIWPKRTGVVKILQELALEAFSALKEKANVTA